MIQDFRKTGRQSDKRQAIFKWAILRRPFVLYFHDIQNNKMVLSRTD